MKSKLTLDDTIENFKRSKDNVLVTIPFIGVSFAIPKVIEMLMSTQKITAPLNLFSGQNFTETVTIIAFTVLITAILISDTVAVIFIWYSNTIGPLQMAIAVGYVALLTVLGYVDLKGIILGIFLATILIALTMGKSMIWKIGAIEYYSEALDKLLFMFSFFFIGWLVIAIHLIV